MAKFKLDPDDAPPTDDSPTGGNGDEGGTQPLESPSSPKPAEQPVAADQADAGKVAEALDNLKQAVESVSKDLDNLKRRPTSGAALSSRQQFEEDLQETLEVFRQEFTKDYEQRGKKEQEERKEKIQETARQMVATMRNSGNSENKAISPPDDSDSSDDDTVVLKSDVVDAIDEKAKRLAAEGEIKRLREEKEKARSAQHGKRKLSSFFR